MAAQLYRVLTGLNYGDTRREAGDVCDDIPGSSIPWLREQGHIEAVEAVADPAPVVPNPSA